MRTFLHVGCGLKRKNETTREFASENWRELRLDIDLQASPDIVGTMLDMSAVADESVDAIFSSHNIEHLYPHEVPVALSEFNRVLSPTGYLVVTCPDLKTVAALIAADKLTDQAYMSEAGPITPLDILYGHRASMMAGNLYMAHRCGFTQKVLEATLRSGGFAVVASAHRDPPYFDLWAVASKAHRSDEEIMALAMSHFPS